MTEPKRTTRLKQLRAKVLYNLQGDISCYREVVRELRQYRVQHTGEKLDFASDSIHTAMSLKFNHLHNHFAALMKIDSAPSQMDLFG
nr:hypothetical protein [uncultured Cohaesibacter sp.]